MLQAFSKFDKSAFLKNLKSLNFSKSSVAAFSLHISYPLQKISLSKHLSFRLNKSDNFKSYHQLNSSEISNYIVIKTKLYPCPQL